MFSTLWAENVPSPSWWQLGVYFTPYDLPEKRIKPFSSEGEVHSPLAWLLDYMVH